MNGISKHTEHGLFADDTVLWTYATKLPSLTGRLQQSIDAFASWCESWKLQLQPTKTEMIHFRIHPRKRYKHSVEVKVGDITIKPLDATRYLGVIIDSRLKWRNHLQHIESKMAARTGLLSYLARAAREPNTKTMINIFKSIARTVMVYGYPVMLTANDRVWDRLQIIQNKALRAALDLPSYTSVEYIHRLANVPKIKDYALSSLRQSIAIANFNQAIILRDHLQNILEQHQNDNTPPH